MAKRAVFCTALFLLTHSSRSSHIFHENTHITFYPEFDAEYFGYSTLLSPDGLLVGAPKAFVPNDHGGMKTGTVFNCPLQNLDVKNISCTILRRNGRLGVMIYYIIFTALYGCSFSTEFPKRGDNDDMFSRVNPGFLRDDMWFGATMASLPNGRLMINAPRWTAPYGKKHLLMNGCTYLQSSRSNRVIYPLKLTNRQAYVTDGSRREYGEYGTHLNFYAYGQAGSSIAVTKLNTVILGAPGLLQWTGGVISMSFLPNDTSTYTTKLLAANPYFSRDIGPDEYFGYSVESGVFQKDGNILYVAGAPRANIAGGKVLIFEPPILEFKSLNIKMTIKGPQSGSYFGASLCVTDINGDGLDDLLVGAPTYVKNDGGLPYDQGAVFVYMNKEKDNDFVLEEQDHVSGSVTNGAWFGISIGDLGDVDGDGYKDIAIGAPWENDGQGAVYIYKGYAKGLNPNNVQRIQPMDARGFGWSIAKGADVDNNNCNDLAIGAHSSQTSYLYRCIPTMKVHAVIRVPNAINLPQNTTGFDAVFCVSATSPWNDVEINVIGKIEVDPEYNRAMISGDATRKFRVKPGQEICDEQTIEVHPSADLSKPISLRFRLEPDELMNEDSTMFLMNAARLSEESTMKTSFLIQLVRDCGEDLICIPWLVMTLEALDKNEDITWEIELDYDMNHNVNDTRDLDLNIKAKLNDALYRNVTDTAFEDIVINVVHKANFSVNGFSCSDTNTRKGDYLRENITFNATTHMIVHGKHNITKFEVKTTLILEPESYTWKLILICVLLGLLLLALIVTILYKRGFFQRTTHKMLQLHKSNQQRLIQESDTSSMPIEEEDDDLPPFDDSD
ncbi:hypothetical protein B5X24_HaOG213949 [Helicoverpa armigera]|uniref:Uncharacterized protein n=1 Tax=Helicoverpa armigera TaxID=29058 RepID=A0A2W1B894_HELAM|nr:hypothetical protein B5X24_HaOG213949 [Helicoverpa armigera]